MSYLFDPNSSIYTPFAIDSPLWSYAYHKKIKILSKEAINELESHYGKICKKNSNRPKSLFKYRSFGNNYHLNILKELKLYLSPYGALNDPIDGNIIPLFDYKTKESLNELKKFNKDFIKKAINNNMALSYEEIRNFDFKHLSVSEINSRVKATIKKIGGLNSSYLWKIYFEKIFHTQVYNSSGVLSLSLCNDDNLLWSHYGESHTGFCIEFDYCSLIIDAMISGKDLHWGEVFYVKSKPKFNVTNNIEHLVQSVLLTKSIEWQYEKEFRIISTRSFGTFSIRPSTIKNIYLGSQCSNQDIELMRKMLSDNLPGVGLYIFNKIDPFSPSQTYKKI